tara:strand:- start:23958 stop:25697 length:1740 start_codon:yes stop_codon:yes gene_type:complete
MSIRVTVLLLLMMFMIGISCTSSRWIVTNENKIDPSVEPTVVNVRNVLLLESEPTYTNPIITFSANQIVDKEYLQRVEMERSVQQFRPRWGFLTLGLSATAFTFIAANTTLISSTIGSNKKLMLNLAGGILGIVSVTNLKPVGEPILTGQKQLMDQSGSVVLSDTLAPGNRDIQLDVDLMISFNGDTVLAESGLQLNNNRLDVNLTPVVSLLDSEIDDDSKIELELSYNGESPVYDIYLSSFLEPRITITDPVAVLRSVPLINEFNAITEVGQGSSLRLLDEDSEWYRVQFGGSEVFVRKNSGERVWKSEESAGAINVFEFEEVPFGEIDVENSVPILKQNNPNDRAIILTNGNSVNLDPRQYLHRDHELFAFYMRSALQMNSSQITTIELDSSDEWIKEFEEFASFDSTSSLFVYLSGYAFQEGDGGLRLQNIDDETSPPILSSYIFQKFEEMNPGSLFFFSDLEFTEDENGSAQSRLGAVQVLVETANALTRRLPNSVLLFSNRPGQKSSVYASSGFQNQRHNIFNYYLADAIKRRNTRMSDIIRHLENNVDYTSRRLHDRSQDIQAFGNTTLRINN